MMMPGEEDQGWAGFDDPVFRQDAMPGELWDASPEDLTFLEWVQNQEEWKKHQTTIRNDDDPEIESSKKIKLTIYDLHEREDQRRSDMRRKIEENDGIPILPCGIQNQSPIGLVNALYSMGAIESTNRSITKESYFIWNKEEDNRLWFTCVLVCPITYEWFPSGQHISTAQTASKQPIDLVRDEHGIVWYSRKKEAEHGAAALRFDCWHYRTWYKNNPTSAKTMIILGTDEPYLDSLEERPQRIKQQLILIANKDQASQIEEQIVKWQVEAEAQAKQEAFNVARVAEEEEEERMTEEENAAYRNAYFRSRNGDRDTSPGDFSEGSDDPNPEDIADDADDYDEDFIPL